MLILVLVFIGNPPYFNAKRSGHGVFVSVAVAPEGLLKGLRAYIVPPSKFIGWRIGINGA